MKRTKDIVVGALLLAIVLVVVHLLSGCSHRPLEAGVGQPTPGPTPGTDLVALGRTLVWIGGLLGFAGVAVRVLAFFNPVIAAFAKLGTVAAEVGVVGIACGVSCIWLGQNLWAFVLALVLTALAWAWVRRRSIRRWLGLGQASDKSTVN